MTNNYNNDNNYYYYNNYHAREQIEYDTNMLDQVFCASDIQGCAEGVNDAIYQAFPSNLDSTIDGFKKWKEKAIEEMMGLIKCIDDFEKRLVPICKLRINFVLLQCTIKLVVLANRAKKRVQVEYATGGKRAKLLKKEYEKEFVYKG